MDRETAIAALTGPGGRFEVVTEEVRGRPMPVFKERLSSLRDIAEIARRRGDERTFLVSGERRYGFATFVDTSNGVGRAFGERLGVAPGDRVAVLAQNSAEWCLSLWATVNMGAVLVGLNGWWQPGEVAYGLDDSGAKVLVADRKRIERVAPVLDDRSALEAVVLTDCAPEDVDLPSRLTVIAFADLATPSRDLPDVPLDEDDPAIVLYTSGTTGRPKGSISTHRNAIAVLAVAQLGAAVTAMVAGDAAAPERRAVALFTSPLFHVSGCHSVLVAGLLTGLQLVLVEGKFEPEKCFEAIERERVTFWGTVPTLVWRACTDPSASRYDTSSVNRVVYGGSPSASKLQELVRQTFPNVKTGAGQSYGMTETSGTITSLGGEDLAAHAGSVGKPLPTVDVRIADDGEILVRGPMVTPGYWPLDGDGEEWFPTGDIGDLDEDGYLFITDRKKDVIIRGGENVYCVEVEQRLIEHPSVRDAAVVGVPHDDLGEEVKAVIVPAAPVDAEGLRAWVRETLADFKVPRHVEFRSEELPRNAAGKLLKDELRPR